MKLNLIKLNEDFKVAKEYDIEYVNQLLIIDGEIQRKVINNQLHTNAQQYDFAKTLIDIAITIIADSEIDYEQFIITAPKINNDQNDEKIQAELGSSSTISEVEKID